MASAPPTAASFTPMRGRAGQGFAGPAGTVTGRDCLRESCTQDGRERCFPSAGLREDH